MTPSITTEFINLCRTQVTLLTQTFGATLTAVYLKESLIDTENSKLVPIIVYPETGKVDEVETSPPPVPISLAQERNYPLALAPSAAMMPVDFLPGADQQMVLPIMYDNIVMGVLVTSRENRAWKKKEKMALEKIAQTIAIACLMEQKVGWYEQQLNQRLLLESQQRNLLDNLLHQFRNPLTALRTFSKLLLKRLVPPDSNRDVANSIVRESDRLQELLKQFDQAIDLTDVYPHQTVKQLTGSSSSSLFLPVADDDENVCSVAEVLTPLIDNAIAIATDKNIEVIAIIPPQLPLIKGTDQALREVLSNLIDNAIKYTAEQGKVYIELSSKGLWQQIEISDSGYGIPDEDLEHIFERSYRGVQGQGAIPGTGLGLAIARDLITQMGGDIEVFSPSKHQWNHDTIGTTFMIYLKVD
jgi:signal transduction histidine kinase